VRREEGRERWESGGVKVSAQLARRAQRDKSDARFCAWYSRLMSLDGALVLMPRTVSRTWVGRPNWRSRRHVWHTFLAFAHTVQISVFLYREP